MGFISVGQDGIFFENELRKVDLYQLLVYNIGVIKK
jgi:hypothetical protein